MAVYSYILKQKKYSKKKKKNKTQEIIGLEKKGVHQNDQFF